MFLRRSTELTPIKQIISARMLFPVNCSLYCLALLHQGKSHIRGWTFISGFGNNPSRQVIGMEPDPTKYKLMHRLPGRVLPLSFFPDGLKTSLVYIGQRGSNIGKILRTSFMDGPMLYNYS